MHGLKYDTKGRHISILQDNIIPRPKTSNLFLMVLRQEQGRQWSGRCTMPAFFPVAPMRYPSETSSWRQRRWRYRGARRREGGLARSDFLSSTARRRAVIPSLLPTTKPRHRCEQEDAASLPPPMKLNAAAINRQP
jgi:hypothetical protein